MLRSLYETTKPPVWAPAGVASHVAEEFGYDSETLVANKASINLRLMQRYALTDSDFPGIWRLKSAYYGTRKIACAEQMT